MLAFCCNDDQILSMSYMLSFVQTKSLSSSMSYFYKMWSIAINEVDNNNLIIRVMKLKVETVILQSG
jgi:hypothetical protein